MPITDNTPPPVKKTPARTTAKKTGTAETTMLERRTSELSGLGGLAQVPLIAMRQYADAGAVSMHWPKIAREIALLAEDYEQVARLIDPLMQIGPFAGVIAAVLPFILQVGVNHKRVPAGAMGTVPATALSAQIETALAQQELQALREQLEAERQAREMRDEIAEARAAMQEQMAA